MSEETKEDSTESKTDLQTKKDDSKTGSQGKETNKESEKGESSEGKKSEEKGFSAEYVKTLREENKAHRLRAEELEKTANEANKKALEAETKAAEEALKKVQGLHNAFERRLINAELQNLATKEGLIDMDAIKMVDMSTVKLSENGEVEGLDTIMADLKKNKAYLFKAASTSHANPKDPNSESKHEKPVYKDAKELEAATKKLLSKYR